MSFVFAVPHVMSTAATELTGIGSALGQANSAAAAQTTAVLAAGADEVSAAVAAIFADHGQGIRPSVPRPRHFTTNSSRP
jgi:hypothetical protein